MARTGRGVCGKIRSANWGGGDRHLGSADGDDKPKRAHGVGEGRPPWLSALPVNGSVLLDRIGKGDLEMGWNDLAHRERQRNLVAKTLKWGVLGGPKDVDLWFVGPDCGSCGAGGTRVWGGNEQEFGLRGSADDERGKDEEGQGRAHINSVLFKRA
jgi:hypothetical protein